MIAIIAILAAILFPVFARAREKARQASCLSNLKQNALAILMYAQDYDGRCPLAYYYSADFSLEWAWDAFVNYGTGATSVGLIGPYTNNAQINQCPSFDGPSWGRPYTGYAYNTSYLGGGQFEGPGYTPRSGASLGSVKSPSETVLLADSAYWDATVVRGLAGNNFLRAPNDPSNYIGPNAHFRHNDTADVAYADGHAKATPRKFNVSSYDGELADLSADDSAYDLQ